ncbi:LPXTG cell wall anchor domain-containing protein [Candidatus Enterococcus murrayae]|uniref:LPXTG cell wall anchor domain-containing protein n=1 Tax=Candidatus Enterococcus murrayae TaxID=2815321 RepID=A0ABS3HGY9_9ENTE|nr:LPXTG cell wall anchor domain-containing protein [Enterococcus sp. MJM16]MBO0452543.1 LPXTG cell wall anchor domain-containing protein [Enterococcus sp. MJM16]
MAKRSIYLFSTMILGFSMVPSTAWADETIDLAATNSSIELVQSSDSSPAASITEESEAEEVPVVEETAEMDAVEPEPVSQTPVAPIETMEAVEEDKESKEASAIDQESKDESVSEETSTNDEATAEVLTTPTAKTALKNDHDGKIVDHSKAVTDENTKVPDDYEFMPNFANVKEHVVGGTQNYTSDGYSYVFDLDSEKPNTITVTYKNVGTYKGKIIDMRITVKGWTALAGRQVLYINKENGITMKGIKDVLLNYSFLDALTATPVKLSGFFNFTDIDFEQSIDLFNNNNIQHFYVTKNNQLYYKIYNEYIKIGEINNQSTNNFDMRYWLAFTYKNVSNFDVRYNQEYETDAVFNYSFKLPFAMGGIFGAVDPTIPLDVEMPDEPNPAGNGNQAAETAASGPTEEKNKLPEAIPIIHKPVQQKQLSAVSVKQTTLPKTNEQIGSILSLVGGACLILSTALFLNRKKA